MNNEIAINEKTYTISKPESSSFVELEKYIISQRIDPFEIAIAKVEKADRRHHQSIWDAAMRQAVSGNTVSAQELNDFENSLRGLGWKVWQGLKTNHPEIASVEDGITLVEKAGKSRLEEVVKKFDVLATPAEKE